MKEEAYVTIDYFINLIEEVKQWAKKDKGKEKVLNLSVYQTLKEKNEIEKAQVFESANQPLLRNIQSALSGMSETQKNHINTLLNANQKSVNHLRELIYDEQGNIKEKLITDINQGPQDQISPPKKMIDTYDSLLTQKKALKTKQNNMMKKINDLRDTKMDVMAKRKLLLDRISSAKRVNLEDARIKLAEARSELETLKKWEQ